MALVRVANCKQSLQQLCERFIKVRSPCMSWSRCPLVCQNQKTYRESLILQLSQTVFSSDFLRMENKESEGNFYEAEIDYEFSEDKLLDYDDFTDGTTDEKFTLFEVKNKSFRRYSEQISNGSSVTESEVSPQISISSQFLSIPYGLILRATYEHGKRHAEIMGVTYNGRMRQFVILDMKGITTWKRDVVEHRACRTLSYPKYEYRLITDVVYAKKYNCYFVLGKDFSLKVYNRDFVEMCSVSASLRSVRFMLFNPVRDELITGGVGGTKIWQFHQHMRNSSADFKLCASFGLTLKCELPHVGGSWVKRAELDHQLEHMYCCSDHDLYVYNLEGHQLFKFERAHSMSITGCRYSRNACVLLTSSLDTEVKVWSLMGGLVHTFRGHSRAVTNLILHPATSSIAVTCSLDGTVRMWSLDTLDCLYSLVVSVDGIQWMGLTDDNLLYMSTPRTLTLWHMNYIVQFWALVRSSVTKLVMCGCKNKTTRIMAISEDSSVRLMARSNRKNLSTVLPPPDVSPLRQVLSVCYSREFNTIYMLINHQEIWVYTTRTDPACRIAIWNMTDIQRMFVVAQASVPVSDSDRTQTNQSSQRHKMSHMGSGSEGLASCCCVAVITYVNNMFTDEGGCSARDSYLLAGLEDGRVLFMDPVIKGQKYLEFKTGKDPVLDICHSVPSDTLLTLHGHKNNAKILVWSLPDLILQHEVYTAADLTCFVRGGDILMTGHKSGCVIFHDLGAETHPGLHKIRGTSVYEEREKTNHKPEHQAPVVAVDVCASLRLFCSCSDDGAVKIWHDLALLREILLDSSLSAACFLNNRGDLVLGYQKHLFYIDHTKVCPQMTVPESDVETFDKESYICEDPAVLYEGVAPNNDPVTLENYLVPFDIEFSKDFLEGRVTLEPDIVKEETSDDEESQSSRAPTEIYLSPPLTPQRRFSAVDLLLGSNISRYDLLKHMKKTLDHLAEKEKLDAAQLAYEQRLEAESRSSVYQHCHKHWQKREHTKDNEGEKMQDEKKGETNFQEEDLRELDMKFCFPRFGKSPGATPEFSAPVTPEVFSDSEEELKELDETQEDNLSLKSKQPVQVVMEEEVDVSKFLKTEEVKSEVKVSHEPFVPKMKFGFSDIKIDVKVLMKDVNKMKPAAAAIPRQQTEPEQVQILKKRLGHREPPAKKKMLVNSQRKSRKVRKSKKQAVEEMSSEDRPTQIQAVEVKEHRLQIPVKRLSMKEDELCNDQTLKEASVSSNAEPKDENCPVVEEEDIIELKVPDLPSLPVSEHKVSRSSLSGSRLPSFSRPARKPLTDTVHSEKSGRDSTRSDNTWNNIWSKDESYNPRTLTDESAVLRDANKAPEGSDGTEVANTTRVINYDQLNTKGQKIKVATILTADGESFTDGWIERDSVSVSNQQQRSHDQHLTNDSDLTDSLIPQASSIIQATDVSAEEMVKAKRRPQTSVADGSEFQSVIKYFRQRPHTADVRFKTEDLKAAFDESLLKYKHMLKSRHSSGKLYRNDDQEFSENWHERQIERHMLIRMQKELRAQNVYKKQLLMKNKQQDQWRQRETEEYAGVPDGMSHSPSHVGRKARTVQSAKLTKNIPVFTPTSFRPHTAIDVFRQISMQPFREVKPTYLKSYPAFTEQQAVGGQARLIKIDLEGKPEVGYRKTYRCRLRPEKEVHECVVVQSTDPVDLWQYDPRNPNALRPQSSKSIPSKCRKYVLVTKPKVEADIPLPTALEKYLLVLRFPQQGERIFKKCLELQMAKLVDQSCM